MHNKTCRHPCNKKPRIGGVTVPSRHKNTAEDQPSPHDRKTHGKNHPAPNDGVHSRRPSIPSRQKNTQQKAIRRVIKRVTKKAAHTRDRPQFIVQIRNYFRPITVIPQPAREKIIHGHFNGIFQRTGNSFITPQNTRQKVPPPQKKNKKNPASAGLFLLIFNFPHFVSLDVICNSI